MGLQSSDHFMISRAGALYKLTGADVLAFVAENVGTSQFEVANIAARNALANLSVGDRIFVNDATGDATVNVGWAIYVYRSPGVFTKMAEQEGLDVVVGGTNLTYTAGPANGIVVSSSGDDATIPAVTAADAGLMLPAHKAKVDFITITQAVDLDAVEAASHAAVTLAGAANNNPLTIAGQQLGFSIANLTTAP